MSTDRPTTNRWQRLEEVFHGALDRSAAERGPFLDQACGGDGEFRKEIESLLAADPATTDPSRESVVAERVRSAAVLVVHPPRQGQRIGQYQIIQEIGHGGMGLVYLASRADDQFKMRVAIKVAQSGQDSEAIRERFRHERQILASLDHPYVAKLLDGGATDDGLPYFVMEYVEGLPIHKYAITRSLSLRERIELFRKVCEAVAYAHQNLVVHLDLKPSNILVTADGKPKLLDFGIARLLDSTQATHRTSAFGSQRLMTPDYASPEQIRGEAVTTSTDVYSLGAVLYQLLTGSLPHRLEGLTPRDIEKTVCDTEPVPPSQVVPRLRRQLAGDLDNIVMHAMAKEPARRYGGVLQLDDELRRYLNGLPVRARAGSVLYRARKFVWRHRLPVFAMAAIVVSLAGGLVMARWQARMADELRHVADIERGRAESNAARAQANALRAESNAAQEKSARDRADQATRRAEQASREAQAARLDAEAQRKISETHLKDVHQLATKYIFDFSDGLRTLPGALPVRKQMMDVGMKFLDKLGAENRNDPGLDGDLASGYMRLADTLGNPGNANLGDTKGALESYRKALVLLEKSNREQPNHTDYLFGQSEIRLKMAQVLMATGAREEGLREFENARKCSDELTQLMPGDYYADRTFANNLTLHASALLNLGEDRAALEMLQRDGPRVAGFVERHADQPDMKFLYGEICEDEGRALAQTGDLTGAITTVRKASGIFNELVRRVPRNTMYQRLEILSYRHMGDIYGNPTVANLGDVAGAAQAYGKMKELSDALLAADPGNVSTQREAALSDGRMGVLRLAQKDPRAAVMEFDKAITALDKIVTRDPANLRNTGFLEEYIELRGDAMTAVGDLAAAGEAYAKAYALAARISAHDPGDAPASSSLAETQLKSGLVLSQRGDRKALDMADRAIAEMERSRGLHSNDPHISLRLARCLAGRAVILTRLALSSETRQDDLKHAREALDSADHVVAQVPAEHRHDLPAVDLEMIAHAHALLAER